MIDNLKIRHKLIISYLAFTVIAIGAVYVLLRTSQAEPIANTVWVSLLVISVGLLSLAGGLAVVLSNNFTQPLKRLDNTIGEIRQGDLSVRVPIDRQDELGNIGQSLNEMTTTLQEVSAQQEESVQTRIRALEASDRITRGMLVIKDEVTLLNYVVECLQSEFGFDYVQIYLVEAESGDLVLAKGGGKVGEQLQALNHRLSEGQGIVGTVASTNDPFWSNDVQQSLNFVENAYLPDIRSELAVPLRREEGVAGVLDIQSKDVNRFTEGTIGLMQSLANQVAILLEKIALIQEMEKKVQEVGRLNSRLTRSSWAEVAETAKHSAYRYIRGEEQSALPTTKAGWYETMKRAELLKELVTSAKQDNIQTVPEVELAVPLMLRGEVIGTIGVKKQNANYWSQEEKEVIEAVANQTSLALENARLSEEQERQIEELQEVDRLKGEFLTSMSHELRTPLNSIIGFADILLQGIDGPLTDHALTDVTAIHNSGKHLLSLINDLLDLSKIEAGRMELAREPLSLADTFGEVASATAALFAKKPVELVIDVPGDMPPVWADPLRISQILINLVGNGEKFTEEGQVTMRAVRSNINHDLVEISVSDTGIGIPEDKFDLIFQHFRQVDGRTNRKFTGTGMGLAIAKQLTEIHGGEMWLESSPGEGSTFFFTVPVATEAIMAQPQEEAVLA
ncbi:MAG: ATP-binding protein [Chloroflexota bacterium]